MIAKQMLNSYVFSRYVQWKGGEQFISPPIIPLSNGQVGGEGGIFSKKFFLPTNIPQQFCYI
jgi:hypothetical protein